MSVFQLFTDGLAHEVLGVTAASVDHQSHSRVTLVSVDVLPGHKVKVWGVLWFAEWCRCRWWSLEALIQARGQVSI